MVRSLVAAFLLLTVAVAAAAAEEAPGVPAPGAPDFAGWTKVAGVPCDIDARHFELSVLEGAVKNADGTTTMSFMGDACLAMTDIPITCLSFITEAETLRPGATQPDRSFVVRCAPESKVAWILASRWSAQGLALEAWRLDLRSLVTAGLTEVDGVRDVVVPQDPPLLPTPVVTWSVPEPVPGDGCDELQLDLVPGPRMLDLVVAPQASCQGWKIRLDAELGGATASPLSALGTTAPPAAETDAPKAAPPAPAPKRAASHGARGLSSFSRR